MLLYVQSMSPRCMGRLPWLSNALPSLPLPVFAGGHDMIGIRVMEAPNPRRTISSPCFLWSHGLKCWSGRLTSRTYVGLAALRLERPSKGLDSPSSLHELGFMCILLPFPRMPRGCQDVSQVAKASVTCNHGTREICRASWIWAWELRIFLDLLCPTSPFASPERGAIRMAPPNLGLKRGER